MVSSPNPELDPVMNTLSVSDIVGLLVSRYDSKCHLLLSQLLYTFVNLLLL